MTMMIALPAKYTFFFHVRVSFFFLQGGSTDLVD